VLKEITNENNMRFSFACGECSAPIAFYFPQSIDFAEMFEQVKDDFKKEILREVWNIPQKNKTEKVSNGE